MSSRVKESYREEVVAESVGVQSFFSFSRGFATFGQKPKKKIRENKQTNKQTKTKLHRLCEVKG